MEIPCGIRTQPMRKTFKCKPSSFRWRHYRMGVVGHGLALKLATSDLQSNIFFCSSTLAIVVWIKKLIPRYLASATKCCSWLFKESLGSRNHFDEWMTKT